MSDAGGVSSGSKPQKKGQVSPIRNAIGALILVAAVLVLAFELSAKNTYNNAINAVNDIKKTLADAETGPTQEEVEKRIGKKPESPLEPVGGELKAVYSWRGIRPYPPLVLFYTVDEQPPHLLRIGEE